MKSLKTLAILLLVLWANACSEEFVPGQDSPENGGLKYARPHMKIAFIGGLSYMDPSLMINCLNKGSDFMNFISQENVCEELCIPILDQALSQILAEKPDLLLIAGELSYMGEKISHEAVAGILKNISKQGIKVFVVPGNNDISNPSSRAYNGNGSSPVPTVTAEEFENIYSDFGFKDAISRDPNSLSYVTQAFNNVWILGIDARIYPIVNYGLIKPETLEWIKYWLTRAKEKNITVLGLCHHNVTEPWAETAKYGPAYVIKNHETVENVLTEAGLRVIFTAYANDITLNAKENNVLYDICAVYLPSFPHAWRMINMDPNYMEIETRYITSIDATIPGGADFPDYTTACYLERIGKKLTLLFSKPPYNSPRGDVSTFGTADYYGFHIAKALLAFYVGNEQFSPELQTMSQNWSLPYKQILKNVYTDLPPEDLQFTVDMRKKHR